MIEGKTRTGFKYKIDERVANDWRLLDAMRKVINGGLMEKVAAVADMIDFLLGENKEKLMEHIAANNDGFMPSDKLEEELFDIIKGARETKNSSSSPDS